MMRGEDILWTIPVEFKFYLVLPLLMVAILLLLRDRMSIAILVLGVGILLSHWLLPVVEGGVDTFPFIGVFLTGIFLAFLQRPRPGELGTSPNALLLYEALAWLCIAAFVWLIPSVHMVLTGMKMPLTENESHPIYATLWAAMILFMLRGSGAMRGLLESRLLVFLGQISFSLYLWHRGSIYLMHRLTYYHRVDFLPHGLKALIILIAAIGMAYLSYVLIERPVQRWRARRAATTKNFTGRPLVHEGR
jgi:peptidoglycan/LPS O-acetylase OafA/YrhL